MIDDDDPETLTDEDEEAAEAPRQVEHAAAVTAKPRTARKAKTRAAKATPKKAKADKLSKGAKKGKGAKAGKASKAAKGAKKAKAVKAVPPSGLAGVKVGGHVLWVARAVARALNAKDRKKLKAVLKRAEKRAKPAK